MINEGDPKNIQTIITRVNSYYDEVCVVSLLPSFIPDLYLEGSKELRNDLINAIKNRIKNNLTTHLYIIDVDMALNSVSADSCIQMIKDLDEVRERCNSNNSKIKVDVIDDSQVPFVSYVEGKKFETKERPTLIDLYVEYKVGVKYSGRYSNVGRVQALALLNYSEDAIKDHLKLIPYADLRTSITRFNPIDFSDWYASKRARIVDYLLPPDIVIMSALPLEIKSLLKMYVPSEYDKLDLNDRGKYLVRQQPLQILFSRLSYGRSSVLKQVYELNSKYIKSTRKYLFFVGIAGGVKDRVKLGDVVISSSIVTPYYEKLFKMDRPPRSAQGGQTIKISDDVSMYFRTLPLYVPEENIARMAMKLANFSTVQDDQWKEYLESYLTSPEVIETLKKNGIEPSEITEFLSSSLPIVYYQPIWSSDHNVHIEDFSKQLGNTYGVYAIDMEGGGLIEAASNFGYKCIEVRAISDMCGDRKNDERNQSIAGAIAGAALNKLLSYFYI
jgi:purine-nucleoside phosphorylase